MNTYYAYNLVFGLSSFFIKYLCNPSSWLNYITSHYLLTYIPNKSLYLGCTCRTQHYCDEFIYAGFLSAPNGLQAYYQKTSSSIEVNWDKPFTIDITTTEPDIQKYTVYITNVNTGTEVPVNLTDTTYVFTEASPDPCHIYEFSISAWNMVGEGERSDKVTAYFILGWYYCSCLLLFVIVVIVVIVVVVVVVVVVLFQCSSLSLHQL